MMPPPGPRPPPAAIPAGQPAAMAGAIAPPAPPPSGTTTPLALPTLLPLRRNAGAGSAAPAPAAGVRATNDDAQASKHSAVSRGYFDDPFVELFVRRPQRRSPLINRGYWARHAAMRRLILAFLRHYAPAEPTAAATESARAAPPPPEPTCQVVVLGAGYDTTWLQLCREHDAHVAAAAGKEAAPAARPAAPAADPGAGGGVRPGRDVADVRARVRWVEVDFPDVVASKARVLLSGGVAAATQPAAPPPPPPSSSALLFPPSGGANRPPASSSAAAQQAAALVRAQLTAQQNTATTPPLEILGRAYASVGADLRAPERELGPALVRAGAAVEVEAEAGKESSPAAPSSFALRLPTLFVAECVLAYLEPEEARGLLEFVGRMAAAAAEEGQGQRGASGGGDARGNGVPAAAAVIAYDVVSPDDAFGRQMQANLAARGCPMRGVAAAPDPPAQAARLRAALSAGADRSSAPVVVVEADALDMGGLWSEMLGVDLEGLAEEGVEGAAVAMAAAGQGGERRRAERLEPLDELEEWALFGAHYCVAVGARGPAELSAAMLAALRPRRGGGGGGGGGAR